MFSFRYLFILLSVTKHDVSYFIMHFLSNVQLVFVQWWWVVEQAVLLLDYILWPSILIEKRMAQSLIMCSYDYVASSSFVLVTSYVSFW